MPRCAAARRGLGTPRRARRWPRCSPCRRPRPGACAAKASNPRNPPPPRLSFRRGARRRPGPRSPTRPSAADALAAAGALDRGRLAHRGLPAVGPIPRRVLRRPPPGADEHAAPRGGLRATADRAGPEARRPSGGPSPGVDPGSGADRHRDRAARHPGPGRHRHRDALGPVGFPARPRAGPHSAGRLFGQPRSGAGRDASLLPPRGLVGVRPRPRRAGERLRRPGRRGDGQCGRVRARPSGAGGSPPRGSLPRRGGERRPSLEPDSAPGRSGPARDERISAVAGRRPRPDRGPRARRGGSGSGSAGQRGKPSRPSRPPFPPRRPLPRRRPPHPSRALRARKRSRRVRRPRPRPLRAGYCPPTTWSRFGSTA